MISPPQSPLANLEPQPVWTHFDGIRQIPRPSRREDRIVQFVRDWASQHGFTVREDAVGNMVVAVPASPGKEGAPTVVLQGHLDMVCEKNAGSTHDFENDPIVVAVDGDWVRAEGTTLGADNGLGVAAAMAVAVDPEVVHPALELLFTLDEETGLNGASALDPALVTGRRLLNLDTEEDDAVYIGCAGAAGVEAHFELSRKAAAEGSQAFELAVRGLRGGHSGIEIHCGLGNASKVAAQVLVGALAAGIDLQLVSFTGGSKANAIPRECFVEVLLNADGVGALHGVIEEVRQGVLAELGSTAEQLDISLTSKNSAERPIASTDRDRLLDFVLAAPHGALAMSREVPGLVETSNNLAVVRTEGDSAMVLCAFRSSVNASLVSTSRSIQALCRLAGAKAKTRGGYPGWKPVPDAPLVRRATDMYSDLFGTPPEVKAVHAGLECGILVEKLPGLEAVSLGPEIRGAHSPDERASIPSVAKFYRWLSALLADLAG